MAVADADYHFVYSNMGSYDKDCDSTIFKRCTLWQGIESNATDLPEVKSLYPEFTDYVLSYFLVGDEAFGLHKYLLRPFRGTGLTIKKKNTQIPFIQSTSIYRVHIQYI
ncbi:hypothetical protein PGB90_005264 [Kerria lacca]